jgi:hypothetical protein
VPSAPPKKNGWRERPARHLVAWAAALVSAAILVLSLRNGVPGPNVAALSVVASTPAPPSSLSEAPASGPIIIVEKRALAGTTNPEAALELLGRQVEGWHVRLESAARAISAQTLPRAPVVRSVSTVNANAMKETGAILGISGLIDTVATDKGTEYLIREPRIFINLPGLYSSDKLSPFGVTLPVQPRVVGVADYRAGPVLVIPPLLRAIFSTSEDIVPRTFANYYDVGSPAAFGGATIRNINYALAPELIGVVGAGRLAAPSRIRALPTVTSAQLEAYVAPALEIQYSVDQIVARKATQPFTPFVPGIFPQDTCSSITGSCMTMTRGVPPAPELCVLQRVLDIELYLYSSLVLALQVANHDTTPELVRLRDEVGTAPWLARLVDLYSSKLDQCGADPEFVTEFRGAGLIPTLHWRQEDQLVLEELRSAANRTTGERRARWRLLWVKYRLALRSGDGSLTSWLNVPNDTAEEIRGALNEIRLLHYQPQADFEQARLEWIMGRKDDAAALFRSVLSRVPKHLLTRFLLALLDSDSAPDVAIGSFKSIVDDIVGVEGVAPGGIHPTTTQLRYSLILRVIPAEPERL